MSSSKKIDLERNFAAGVFLIYLFTQGKGRGVEGRRENQREG
jgi:hypothetical protein